MKGIDMTSGGDKTDQPIYTKPVHLWRLSGEIGFKIAIPLILFTLLGIKADKTIGTLPLFTILAIITSSLVSAYLISQQIKKIQQASKIKETRNG